METPNLAPKNDIEQVREKLSEEVKLVLEKYSDQIQAFNLLTCSKNANGFWETNEGIKPVAYDSRHDAHFEFHGLPRQSDYDSAGVNGYILDKEVNRVTFVGSLGRTPDGRPGNICKVTLKFLKDSENFKEVIGLMSELFATIEMHYSRDNESTGKNLRDIAREGIPMLKAFEPLAKKFPATGRISIPSMIDEYQQILNS